MPVRLVVRRTLDEPALARRSWPAAQQLRSLREAWSSWGGAERGQWSRLDDEPVARYLFAMRHHLEHTETSVDAKLALLAVHLDACEFEGSFFRLQVPESNLEPFRVCFREHFLNREDALDVVVNAAVKSRSELDAILQQVERPSKMFHGFEHIAMPPVISWEILARYVFTATLHRLLQNCSAARLQAARQREAARPAAPAKPQQPKRRQPKPQKAPTKQTGRAATWRDAPPWPLHAWSVRYTFVEVRPQSPSPWRAASEPPSGRLGAGGHAEVNGAEGCTGKG